MTVSAVVFDFDYTLTVPDRPRQEVLDEATDAVGAPRMSREAYLDAHSRHLDSDSRVPIFAELLPEDSDVDPAALADAYREKVADSLRSVEGVAGLLADLLEEYALGLLTNGPADAQQSKLDRFDWVEEFDAVVITGHLEAGKPDERAFRAVLDGLGVDPDEAVYVGDDPEADVEGAKNAGMHAVQVLYADGPEPHPDADAHVERDALATELPDVIRQL
ncbi:HAD family hydrolase [Halorussus rarus]|uniref:HAD family hydrolase n=1 Tax=Halorussus TaxID=1070314 RepID=UPI000E215426|nr:HAD family hydrolase [Halorussus rarus]NHN59846.1 HAD family hydrolase [Halorussus sp. JP-T4]